MSKIVVCKKCGKEYNLSDYNGKKYVCPLCKKKKDEKWVKIKKVGGEVGGAVILAAVAVITKGKSGKS